MLITSTASGQGPWSWVPVKPPGENFSVRMPKQPSSEQVEMPGLAGLTGTTYSATGNKIYYTVKSISLGRAVNAQARLDDFITKYKESVVGPGAQFTYVRSLELNGFRGKQYRISAQTMRGLARFYATRQRIYVLEVIGGDEDDAPVGWFLDSFTITETPPGDSTDSGRGKSATDSGSGKSARDFRYSPPDWMRDKPLYYQCACDPLGNPVDQPTTDRQFTRDAIICTKGDLELTDEAIKHQFNGNVILEVELLKDGTVGAINVIQSQPYGLEQRAVEAARRYKFCPALQGGEPVTQIMEYTAMFRVRKVYTEAPVRRTRGRRRP